MWASLHRPLVRGYCLDALDHRAVEAAETADPQRVLDAIASADVQRRPTIGMGEALTFSAAGVGGTALAVDGELVRLTAFPRGAAPEPHPAAVAPPLNEVAVRIAALRSTPVAA